MGHGHYTAYAVGEDGNWYQFDDSFVRKVNEEEVVSSKAYMLLYRRRDATGNCTHLFSDPPLREAMSQNDLTQSSSEKEDDRLLSSDDEADSDVSTLSSESSYCGSDSDHVDELPSVNHNAESAEKCDATIYPTDALQCSSNPPTTLESHHSCEGIRNPNQCNGVSEAEEGLRKSQE